MSKIIMKQCDRCGLVSGHSEAFGELADTCDTCNDSLAHIAENSTPGTADFYDFVDQLERLKEVDHHVLVPGIKELVRNQTPFFKHSEGPFLFDVSISEEGSKLLTKLYHLDKLIWVHTSSYNSRMSHSRAAERIIGSLGSWKPDYGFLLYFQAVAQAQKTATAHEALKRQHEINKDHIAALREDFSNIWKRISALPWYARSLSRLKEAFYGR